MGLEIEFAWYIDNQNELVKTYNGKHVVIKDCKVIGAYKTHLEAYYKPQVEHELGTFLIQLCTPGPDAYTHYRY